MYARDLNIRRMFTLKNAAFSNKAQCLPFAEEEFFLVRRTVEAKAQGQTLQPPTTTGKSCREPSLPWLDRHPDPKSAPPQFLSLVSQFLSDVHNIYTT